MGHWLSRLGDRLDTRPDQDVVIDDAVRELMRELRELRDEGRATRGDLGAAIAGERLDEERLGELFARHDELLGDARKAVVGALAKIHDVLDPQQREELARMLGRRRFGPYRM